MVRMSSFIERGSGSLMMKNVEVGQCSLKRYAFYAFLASLIAAFCLMGSTHLAYADTAEGAEPAAPTTSTPSDTSGDTGDPGSSDDANSSVGDDSNGSEGGSQAGTTTGGSQTNVDDGQGATKPGNGAQGAVTSKPSAGQDQTTNTSTSVKQKPEKKPTKAGWLQDTDGTWYYYTNPNAKPATGWVKSGSKWYWLQADKNGAMATSQWITDKGKRYYVNASGVMLTKWFKIGNDWYYANKSGVVQTSGWVKSGSKWYWLQADQQGKMAAGTWITDKGKRYYLNNSGAMATKWFKVGSDWYYANKSGVQQTSGWVKSGSKWYWLQGDQQGKMAVDQWITDKGKRYYLTNKGPGQMATKWFKIGNDWYYANKSGAQQTSGWVKSGSKWYWLQGDKQGVMFAHGTKTINKAQYAFDSNGAMRANCQVDLGDGVARYAASSGALARIGEYKDGDVVLTNTSGQILTGWQKLAGMWFYGEAGTGIAQTGWLKLGKTWYYLDSNGAMVTGTRNIDGKTHLFTNSGKWLGTDAMAAKAQGYASGTNWLILVDRSAHRVGIFNGSKGNWNRSQTFLCVTGAPGSQTITGVYRTTGGKRMNLSTDSRARWCTQIHGGYFFHTILASESELGHSLSHGCIRLAVPNAQWIYNHIGAGTTVVIYN